MSAHQRLHSSSQKERNHYLFLYVVSWKCLTCVQFWLRSEVDLNRGTEHHADWTPVARATWSKAGFQGLRKASRLMALRKIRIGLLLSAHMTPGPVRTFRMFRALRWESCLCSPWRGVWADPSSAQQWSGPVCFGTGFGAEPPPLLAPPSLSSASLRKKPSCRIRIGLRIGIAFRNLTIFGFLTLAASSREERERLQRRLLLNSRAFSQAEIQKRIMLHNAESAQLPLNNLFVFIQQRLAGKFGRLFSSGQGKLSSDRRTLPTQTHPCRSRTSWTRPL